jgi:LacI family transcriptional regulator
MITTRHTARKRAGIHRIAELGNVSIGTVDRALKGRAGVNENTRKKILQIAKDLAYKPHPAARALAIRRAHLRIGVCIPEEIHFFYDQMRAGILDEAALVSGLGIELVHRPLPGLGKHEKKQIESLLSSGVNAMIITPGNPRVVAPLIDKAEASNVRAICITTDAPKSSRSSLVGVDPEISGRLAAELMAKFLPRGSQVAVATGMLATEEHRLKVRGFRATFEREYAWGRVVAVLEAHESEKESYRKTCALISQWPSLSGIYITTVNCLPVCRALVERKLAGKVCLVTTDLFQEMIPHLDAGTIAASIYQDPYLQGQLAVRRLVDHLINGTPLRPAYYLNPGIVLRSNLGLFREISGTESSANGERSRAATL